MLVLTRRINESLWIGDAKVTVTSIDRRGSVRVGIEAPREIPILRDEIKTLPTQATDATQGD